MEPTQYPSPVASGGMREGFGSEIRSLREYLSQDSPRTNSIRNNSMQGAAIGTPGTLPTNWSATSSSGLTRSVVGIGTENGMDYIDIRYNGTSAGSGDVDNFIWEANNVIAAVQNQIWSESVYCRIVAGSVANIALFRLITLEYNSGGTQVGADNSPNILAQLNAAQPAASIINNRFSFSFTVQQATAAFLGPQAQLTYVPSSPVDITIRFGWPQLEQGAYPSSPIRTTAAAVTRTVGAVRMPDLGQAPKVVSISGFGSGGNLGAGIMGNCGNADRSQGLVAIRAGLAPGSSGNVVLDFSPNTPAAGQYVCFASWASIGALSIAGNQLTIPWTATETLLPNVNYALAYQWTTST